MSTEVRPYVPLSPEDPRKMLPIDEVAVLLDVSVKALKDNHKADPDGYPAERVGILWRIPRAWVEAKVAWPKERAS